MVTYQYLNTKGRVVTLNNMFSVDVAMRKAAKDSEMGCNPIEIVEKTPTSVVRYSSTQILMYCSRKGWL